MQSARTVYPEKEPAKVFFRRAEARVAFMPPSGIRCDRVAERIILYQSARTVYPEKEPAKVVFRKAEARVAFMPPSGIRCDRVAERAVP